MMQCYKSTSGVEVQLYNGIIHFWMPDGVYTLRASTMRRHGQYTGRRTVLLHLLDVETGITATTTVEYAETFDDYEIIYRWLMGSGKCDCIRSGMFYKIQGHYECNKGPNRFILQKMVIKGENLNCVVTYRGYM